MAFQLKQYQRRGLDELADFFRKTNKLGAAKRAGEAGWQKRLGPACRQIGSGTCLPAGRLPDSEIPGFL